MTDASDTKRRFARLRLTTQPQPIAEDVWMVRGGFPSKIMNVYFIRDGNGVLAYDAGIRPMAKGIAAAAMSLGGLTRVVLGHSHFDHRGAAASLGVPVLCHPKEVDDAEGDGGAHNVQLHLLDRRTRLMSKPLLRFFDGGPVRIADTLSEGDKIAGFEVIHGGTGPRSHKGRAAGRPWSKAHQRTSTTSQPQSMAPRR
jgi:glyoxylase-like metal-dependent hydrolase (beta-lactamase superfamily II)